MKPDGMLVEPEHLITARQQIANTGGADALNEIAQTEPALASYIHESLATVAGKLTLAGAPTPLVQGAHDDVLAVVLTCVEALRRGHYALWKDTVIGTRLEELDPSLKGKRRRRPKNKPAEGTHNQDHA
jgi:hypothetical protein